MEEGGRGELFPVLLRVVCMCVCCLFVGEGHYHNIATLVQYLTQCETLSVVLLLLLLLVLVSMCMVVLRVLVFCWCSGCDIGDGVFLFSW